MFIFSLNNNEIFEFQYDSMNQSYVAKDLGFDATNMTVDQHVLVVMFATELTLFRIRNHLSNNMCFDLPYLKSGSTLPQDLKSLLHRYGFAPNLFYIGVPNDSAASFQDDQYPCFASDFLWPCSNTLLAMLITTRNTESWRGRLEMRVMTSSRIKNCSFTKKLVCQLTTQ